MNMTCDPINPAYWQRFAETARQMHAEHLASARRARRWGWTGEAAHFLRQAAIDRNMIVIATDAQRRLKYRRTAFAEEVS